MRYSENVLIFGTKEGKKMENSEQEVVLQCSKCGKQISENDACTRDGGKDFMCIECAKRYNNREINDSNKLKKKYVSWTILFAFCIAAVIFTTVAMGIRDLQEKIGVISLGLLVFCGISMILYSNWVNKDERSDTKIKSWPEIIAVAIISPITVFIAFFSCIKSIKNLNKSIKEITLVNKNL